MIQSIRQIRSRVRSVTGIKKLMRAMRMVSAAKLRRVEGPLYPAREYFRDLEEILKNFLGAAAEVSHPLFEERPPKKSLGIFVLTSDSGLCSTYNDKLIRLVENFIGGQDSQKTKDVKLIILGRKGFNHFKKRRFEIIHSYVGLNGRYTNEVCEEITKRLVDIFLNKKVDEIHLAYTRFISKLRSQAAIEKFLPIGLPKDNPVQFLLEPNPERILEELLVRYGASKISLMLLEAFTAEHATRMIAMQSASDNAQDLLEGLILLRNKARQELITKEIIEVTSAVEALKGA